MMHRRLVRDLMYFRVGAGSRYVIIPSGTIIVCIKYDELPKQEKKNFSHLAQQAKKNKEPTVYTHYQGWKAVPIKDLQPLETTGGSNNG